MRRPCEFVSLSINSSSSPCTVVSWLTDNDIGNHLAAALVARSGDTGRKQTAGGRDLFLEIA